MEQSLSSLTFKGSIVEAIVEAKNQRKLLVVYISGDDAESSNLERSTWSSSKVAESLSKYCVLLHIPAGSVDAAQFSAIYPQKTVPCVTAVGYNGVQLWQNEGFVSAEVLASNLEKAWLGLHIQETTASVLTAALASKNSEEASTSRPSNSSAPDFRSSSSSTVPPTDHRFSETNLGVKNEKIEEEKGPEQLVKEDAKSVDEESKVQHVVSVGNDESPNPSEEDKSSFMATIDQQSCSIEHASNTVHASSMPSKLNKSRQSGDSVAASLEAKDAKQEKSGTEDDTKSTKNDCSTKDYTSSDVHLNIRLLSGVNLREKFSMTSTLRVVKDYVDNNQESVSGSYDLAIAYPRKIFTDHDLDKSLSDLGLSNRQALIVVRRPGMSSDFRGTSFDQRTSPADGISSNENGDGYFAYIKRMLSYVNPFSYLGGGDSSATSRPEVEGGMRQYGSNTTAPNDSSPLQNQSTSISGGGNIRNRQPSTTRFGANIHTLKRDEDDERFRGRNSFWNGNSTQYGGDSDNK